jgi:hypothetical protein
MIFSILGRKSMACSSGATDTKPHFFMSLHPISDDPTPSKRAGNGPWFLKTSGTAPHKLAKASAALAGFSCRKSGLTIMLPTYRRPVRVSAGERISRSWMDFFGNNASALLVVGASLCRTPVLPIGRWFACNDIDFYRSGSVCNSCHSNINLFNCIEFCLPVLSEFHLLNISASSFRCRPTSMCCAPHPHAYTSRECDSTTRP